MSKLTELSNSMAISADAIVDEIKNIFKERGIKTLHTEKPNCDTIYGYLADDSTGYVLELQVKAILVENDEVYVCLDDKFTEYSDEAIAALDDDPDNGWLSLKYSDVLWAFTAMNIAEVLDEYLK